MFSSSQEIELSAEKVERIRSQLPVRYALYGFLVGTAFVGASWAVQILSNNYSFEWAVIRRVHEESPFLFLVDILAPFGLGVLFWRLGRAQAKVRASNMILEDRVRERTMEITLEKARTSAILDSAADSIIAFTEDGKICLYNNAAEKLFDYKYSEAIGRNIQSLIPAFEKAQGSFSHLVREFSRVSRPGYTSNYTALRKDGTTIPVELDLSEFTLGDEMSYTVIVRDLTERRRMERLERSLLQVTEAVNQSKDLNQLYKAIHDSLGQVIDVTNFYIALLEPGRSRYRIAFSVDEEFARPTQSYEVRKSLVDLVIKAGRPLLLGQEQYRELVKRGEIESDGAIPSVSWLGVPLVSDGEAIGMMVVHSHEEGVFYTEKDMWVMNFVSGQIASAIEREHAREMLRQNERRYRRMVEEAGDIVYTTDLSGRFTYTNPPIIKLTGYPEDELADKHSSFLVEPEWRTQVKAFYTRQLRDRSRETVFEFPIITKGGQRRWIEQNTTLLVENDRPSGFQAIVHDITERREAEAALREREERFRSLSASSPIGIFQVNPKGTCTYTNRRWQEITGRTLEESLGTGWLEAIHPSDRQTFKIEWIFSRDEQATSAREVRVLREDGTVRWVNIRWTATVDDYQQLTGYVGTFEDITHRRHTEQLNRVLYEISQAAQTSDDLHAFFLGVQRSLSSVIDTSNFYIAVYDRERHTISFPHAREGEEQLNLSERPVGKGLTGYVIRTGRPLLADENTLRQLYESGEVKPVGKPTKNWLGVPLMAKEGVIGAVVLQSYTSSTHFSEDALQTMGFVSSQIASALLRKQGEEERRRYTFELAEAHNRIKDDLRLAARVQQSRLPREKPPTKQVEFSWLFDSCDEVAGDMFNFVPLADDRIGIYILDVSGHGIPAALLSMALSRSMTAAPDGSGALVAKVADKLRILSPAEVAELMNERYPMNLEINQYFTFLYGILNTTSYEFTFARAGHPAPVLVTRDGARLVDEACGPAIGIIPQMKFEEVTIQLSPGDQVVLYTDGIDEAANPEGEEFGVNRVLESLANRQPTIEDDIRRLREQVRNFTVSHGQADDITLVGFRIKSDAPAAKAAARGAVNGADI